MLLVTVHGIAVPSPERAHSRRAYPFLFCRRPGLIMPEHLRGGQAAIMDGDQVIHTIKCELTITGITQQQRGFR